MSELPTISLGGKDYPVKPLVIRQLRIVEPAYARLREANAKGFSTQDIDDLTDICYQAVGPETMTRDQFINLPIRTKEMVAAMLVIAQQAGMVKSETALGEAQAGNSPTGTES